MGRMKEKFLDEQQRRDAEMQNQYLDDDYCCGQQCGCHEENEANANAAEYDAWWDSLTDDQKEQLFKDQDASEKAYYESKRLGWPYNGISKLASLPENINNWLKNERK